MEWRDIKAEMAALVGEKVSPLGYKFVKSQDSFERRSGDETRFIFLGFVAKKNAFHHMRPWCGIRNAEIERVFHKTSGVDAKYQRNYTVVNAGRHDSLDLDTAQERETAKQQIAAFLREVALPLLEREYSIQDYSRMLNTNPSMRCAYHANPENRCHYGLICARMVDDLCYTTVKTAYSAYLQETSNGFYYPRFLDLVTDIEGNGT